MITDQSYWMTSRLEGLGISRLSHSPELGLESGVCRSGQITRSRGSYVHSSQTCLASFAKILWMTSQSLASALEEFLSESNSAVVIEDGAVVFDFAQTKYSVSGENNKCLLHMWSPERNVVRRVLDLNARGETLRVTVQKIGQARPSQLEICRERDRRTPSAKRAARVAYQRVLERVLRKHFADFTIAQLSTSIDLEKSFGPVYARGLLKRGQSGFALLGVNSQELQASIDASLTFGILWLDVCRQAQAGKLVIEGLKLFVPDGCSEVVRARMAHLNASLAKWQLYELQERSEEIKSIEVADSGNISTRLVQCVDETQAFTRFESSIALVRTLMPEVELGVISPAEIAFRCFGLEFARARLSARPGQFLSEPEIVFGLGPHERVLEASNFQQFERLVR